MARQLTATDARAGLVERPRVRRIGFADLRDALSRGVDDFRHAPTQLFVLGILYPIVGLALARAAFGDGLLPLLYPLATGFALLGPLAATGMYAMSKRRERGEEVSWLHAFDVLRSPSFFSLVCLGLVLFAVFVLWMGVAGMIFRATMGGMMATSVMDFAQQVLHTPSGQTLIVVGNIVGALFACLVLTLGVVSFPLLVDRDVGPIVALSTSVRAVRTNPLPMLGWGVIVAAALALGSLPFLVGLAVAVPVLGHGTWHLYRKVVEA